MKVSIIGSGGWGTALAVLLIKNNHEVTLISHTKEESEAIKKNLENPLLKGVKIPAEINFTTDKSLVAGCDILLLATPSFAIYDTVKSIGGLLSEHTVVVNVSKGLDMQNNCRLSQTIEKYIKNKLVVLSGPTHAEEVAIGIPTAIVAASEDEEAAKKVQAAFMNESFRVYINDDVIGVELGGAFKNIIALAAGISDGMGLGDNTKAALMTRGMAEMARLCTYLGGRADTLAGLTGMGDLIVTCTSMHSRNRRAGMLIGSGVEVKKALEQVGAVVEGYFATAAAKKYLEGKEVEMPILNEIYEVLYQNKDPKTAIKELMTRDKKSEKR